VTFPDERDDHIRAIVQAFDGDPSDAYWARRLLEVMLAPSEVAAYQERLVQAIGTLADYDPALLVHSQPYDVTKTFWWTTEILDAVEARLDAREPVRHWIVGRLWWVTGSAESKELRAQRAMRHLLQVEIGDGGMTRALHWPHLARLVEDVLAALTSDALDDVVGELIRTRGGTFRATEWLRLLADLADAQHWHAFGVRRPVYASLQRLDATTAAEDDRVAALDALHAAELTTRGR
jgi:hypothetical protein